MEISIFLFCIGCLLSTIGGFDFYAWLEMGEEFPKRLPLTLLLGMAAFAKSYEFLKDGIKTPDLKTLEAENKDLKNRLNELEEIHQTPEIQLALLEIEANKIRKK